MVPSQLFSIGCRRGTLRLSCTDGTASVYRSRCEEDVGVCLVPTSEHSFTDLVESLQQFSALSVLFKRRGLPKTRQSAMLAISGPSSSALTAAPPSPGMKTLEPRLLAILQSAKIPESVMPKLGKKEVETVGVLARMGRRTILPEVHEGDLGHRPRREGG